MKIGVTGAAGFIGQALLPELQDAGHETIGTDRLPGRGVSDKFDLLDHRHFADWLDTHRPDVVIHLAAQIGRELSEDDVSRTVRWNGEVTALVAGTCREAGIRLVYTSTSEIYGDHGEDVYDEDAPWSLPRNLYGLTKRWGEEVCRLYAPDRLVIVRPSMPYGPGAPPGRGRRAMDNMLWQAHHRLPITVHRGSERSWCWLGDTVRGIRLAVEQPHAGAFNIGRDDDPRSMLEIAQLACKFADAPDDLIVEVDPPERLNAVKRLSTERLRRLGWAPTTDLEDGMTCVYEWIRKFDRNGNFVG